MRNGFVVPNLKKKSLISVDKFEQDNGCTLKFTDEGFVVKDNFGQGN